MYTPQKTKKWHIGLIPMGMSNPWFSEALLRHAESILFSIEAKGTPDLRESDAREALETLRRKPWPLRGMKRRELDLILEVLERASQEEEGMRFSVYVKVLKKHLGIER